jgi:glutaredoxin 3
LPEVVVYTLPTCIYCHLALRLLREKGVEFRQENVAGNTEKRRWLSEVTRSGTLPQTFIDGRPVGGYSELAALDRAGELDVLLGLSSVGVP